MAEIDGVLSLPLERTDAPKYKLVASFKDGRTIRGTTSAYGRWTHLLARREVRKGAQRLYVIRRSESEKAIRQKIREESKQIPKDRLVVFTVGCTVDPHRGQAAMTVCQYEGDHHSENLLRVFHGREQPAILCGYHAQEPIDFTKVKETK